MSSDDIISDLLSLDIDGLRVKLLSKYLEIDESSANQLLATHINKEQCNNDDNVSASEAISHLAKKSRVDKSEPTEPITLLDPSITSQSGSAPLAQLDTPSDLPQKQQQQQQQQHQQHQPTTQSKKQQKKRQKKDQPKLDWSTIPRRRIALKFSYVGTKYNGFAYQKSELEGIGDNTSQQPATQDRRQSECAQDVVTVEGVLIKALQQACLIPSVDACNYTRCGRTDRGVHALGQVIALDVRTKWSPHKYMPSSSPSSSPPSKQLYCWCDIPGYIPPYTTQTEYVEHTHVMAHTPSCRRVNTTLPIVSTPLFPLLSRQTALHTCHGPQYATPTIPEVVHPTTQSVISIRDEYTTRDIEWYMNYRFRPMYPDLVFAKREEISTGILAMTDPRHDKVYAQSRNYNFHQGVSLYDNDLVTAYQTHGLHILQSKDATFIGGSPIYTSSPSSSTTPPTPPDNTSTVDHYHPRFNNEYSPQLLNNDQFILDLTNPSPITPINHRESPNLYHMDRILPLAKDQSFIDDDEYDYVAMLNRLLPDDIRVSAWSPVSPSFSARFQCEGRIYKYFFYLDHMNLAKMQMAANYMIGKHDFRNICTMDVVATHNFVRTISDISIQPVAMPKANTLSSLSSSSSSPSQQQSQSINTMNDHSDDCVGDGDVHIAMTDGDDNHRSSDAHTQEGCKTTGDLHLNFYHPQYPFTSLSSQAHALPTTPSLPPQPPTLQTSTDTPNDNSTHPAQDTSNTPYLPPETLCEVVIVGEAFLYHQVRSILGLLFLVGRNEESPEIVSELLDITRTPRKPYYNIASDNALVMWEGGYHGMQWKTTTTGLFRTVTSYYQRWRELSIQRHVYEAMWRNAIPAAINGAQQLLTQYGLKFIDYLQLYLYYQSSSSESAPASASTATSPSSQSGGENTSFLHKFTTKPITSMIQAYHRLELTPELVKEMVYIFRVYYGLSLEPLFPLPALGVPITPTEDPTTNNTSNAKIDISQLPISVSSAAIPTLSYGYTNAAPHFDKNRILMLTPFPLSLITPTLPVARIPVASSQTAKTVTSTNTNITMTTPPADHHQQQQQPPQGTHYYTTPLPTLQTDTTIGEYILRIYGMLSFQADITVQHNQDRYLILLILFTAHIVSSSSPSTHGIHVSPSLYQYLTTFMAHGYPYSFIHNHIPLSQRQREDSFEEKLERLNGRKKARKERNVQLNELYHSLQNETQNQLITGDNDNDTDTVGNNE